MSTIHGPLDHRIFHKECVGLARAGFEVSLMVRCGKAERREGVDFVPLQGGEVRGRLGPLVRAWRAWRQAVGLDAELYHFHDPELLPLGLALAWIGRGVVYDSHEDFPRIFVARLKARRKLPGWAWSLLERTLEAGENFVMRRLSGLVAAEPALMERFEALRRPVALVQNFPKLEEFPDPLKVSWESRPPDLAYVGGLTAMRGIREMVRAMGLLDQAKPSRLKLAGAFRPPDLPKEASKIQGWDRVDVLGQLDRRGVADLLSKVRAGLVLLHPNPWYKAAYPVKVFEYMASGLPVIASDFPVLRSILTQHRCGLLVDPLDPRAVAEAIAWVLDHGEEAEAMGRRGREAVLAKYHWKKEEEKLVAFYVGLMGRDHE